MNEIIPQKISRGRDPSRSLFHHPFLLALAAVTALLCSRQAAPAADEDKATADLRVMSFNIRNSGARDGENNWEARVKACLQVIREFDPDLLGLQEVLADQHDTLAKELSAHRMTGVARDDGVREGEWSAILFRTDRFEMLSHGDFWLSENPDEIGSQSWDAACVRICTWAKLRDRRTGQPLLYANTHFDHRSAEARLHSAELLRERLPKLADGAGIILTGDFNCTEDDAPYRVLTKAAPVSLSDSYREVHPGRAPNEASFHGFKGGAAGSRIDWILHTPGWKAASAGIVRGPAERLPSDHFPVTAVLAPKR